MTTANGETGTVKKWWQLWKKGNAYTEAKAEHAFNEHADPKIQLEQAIQADQERQAKLSDLVGTVAGNAHHAEAVLHRYMDQQDSLENDIKAALASGNEDQAKIFATKLASTRANVASQQTLVTQATDAAQKAKAQLVEVGETLANNTAKRQALLSEADQVKEAEAYQNTMKQIAEVSSNHDVPSDADIQDRLDQRMAKTQGDAEVMDLNPDVQEMHVHHAEIEADADSILAEFKTPPAAAAPKTIKAKTK